VGAAHRTRGDTDPQEFQSVTPQGIVIPLVRIDGWPCVTRNPRLRARRPGHRHTGSHVPHRL